MLSFTFEMHFILLKLVETDIVHILCRINKAPYVVKIESICILYLY